MTAQSSYSLEMAKGFEGQLDDQKEVNVVAMRNDEASAELEFGYAIKYASTTDHKSGKKLTAITGETVAGIVVHSHAYDATQLGTSGVKPGNKLSVLRKGRILVACEDGCDVGDRLHVRAVATGGEIAGALRASADGTDTIDSQGQGQWLSSATAGALAWLEVDFLNPLT